MSLRSLRCLWNNSKQKTITEVESKEDENNESKLVGAQVPLLQLWPSQEDSREKSQTSIAQRIVLDFDDTSNVHLLDSGIDSVQASPSSKDSKSSHQRHQPQPPQLTLTEFSEPTAANKGRRTSCSFLHPNHAKLIKTTLSSTSEHAGIEGVTDSSIIGSGSSSTASSMTSITTSVPPINARHSDPWDRRRSSAMATRYSIFDALDLEYMLLRAAARSSVSHSSLSQSIHKLTFTQSLAFPALAKGLAGKHRAARTTSAACSGAAESGCNALAKIITVVVLFVVSLMVFGVVFKYVRT